MLLVAPPVFRAPRGLLGPGCSMCPWAAARPRAVRAASFARRVASKPGQAPPPPTGTAARPSGPSGTLHTSGACCAGDDSPRLEARPGPAAADQHRGLALPPPTGTAPWPCRRPRVAANRPSGPSGALHTGGTCGSGVPGQDQSPTGIATRPSGPSGAPPVAMGVWQH